MTQAFSRSLDHLNKITTSLESQPTNPEVAAILSQFHTATVRFLAGMQLCKKGAYFLTRKRCAAFAIELSPIDDEEFIWHLYNCLCCTKQSLNCLIYKQFREQDLKQMRRFSTEYYSQFFAAFNQRVQQDVADKQVAARICQYAEAVLVQIRLEPTPKF